MRVADRAEPFEITDRRHQHPGRARDRFDNHRGDRLGAVERNQPLEVVGEFGAMLGLAAAVGVEGEIVSMAQVIDPGQQGPELAAIADNPADRDPAETDTMIAALAPDQPGPGALPPRALVSERDLERGIDTFRARIGEEDPVEPFGHQQRDLRRRLERARMGELKGRREIKLARGLADRLDNRCAAVPGVDTPEASSGIEHLVAGAGGVMHALCRDEHPRACLEAAVVGERHPESGEIVGFGHKRSLGNGDAISLAEQGLRANS